MNRSQESSSRVAIAVTLLLAFPVLTGFDLSRHSIDPGEILSGGPPKDGIPAIVKPHFVSAAEAKFLQPSDIVVGIASDGVAKAYPLRILNWHEVVNDEVGGEPVAVTYCPLTASAIVFDRRLKGEILTFGVSGLLYQSNVLIYDRQTESLWSQLEEEAVAGPMTGRNLRALPAVTTTWADWRLRHPDTLVLSPDTGHRRDYGRDPYAAYRASPEPMFPVRHVDERLAPKEMIFGVRHGGVAKAYPLRLLESHPRLEDRIGDHLVRIELDRDSGRVSAVSDRGQPVPGVVAYWFAWAAFHPETEVWASAAKSPPTRAGPEPQGSAIGSERVAIVEHAAYWTELPLVGIDGAVANRLPGVLVIRGEVRNLSDAALDHVGLVFELLDARGKVVASERGYNYGAESLRPVDSPFPVRTKPVTTTSFPGHGTDTFRMLFLRDEIPAFEKYRVRVSEPGPAG
jgi:hypothetical protein